MSGRHLFPGIDGYSGNLRHRIGYLLTGEFFDLTKHQRGTPPSAYAGAQLRSWRGFSHQVSGFEGPPAFTIAFVPAWALHLDPVVLRSGLVRHVGHLRDDASRPMRSALEERGVLELHRRRGRR